MYPKARNLLLFAAAISSLAPMPASAFKGAACGRVAMVDGPGMAYGFSSSVGSWSSVTLDSDLQARLVGTYIGYVRTAGKIYAFNSTTNGWFSTAFEGAPVGEDVQGTTAVFWTNQACYGISTVWGMWRMHEIVDPLGGGSGGNYALVWCEAEAYAYSSSTGQWASQPLDHTPLGGYSSPGLGLIWTMSTAHVYDPIARSWRVLDTGEPDGITMDGSGKVGMVWGTSEADAYSGYLGTWSSLNQGGHTIQGGVASDEVAVLWTESEAFAFDPHAGTWSEITVAFPSGMVPESIVPDGSFTVGPNPAGTGRLRLNLPSAREPWQIEIVDVTGARIRSLESDPDSRGRPLDWDLRNGEGDRVAAGTYWARARSGQRMEARRFVVLH